MAETIPHPATFWDQCVREFKIRHSRFRLRHHIGSPFIYVREMEGGGNPSSVMTKGSIGFRARSSEQIAELLRRQACISRNRAHGDGIDGVMPWNHQPPLTVAHDQVA
jgi:hypothetical protein